MGRVQRAAPGEEVARWSEEWGKTKGWRSIYDLYIYIHQTIYISHHQLHQEILFQFRQWKVIHHKKLLFYILVFYFPLDYNHKIYPYIIIPLYCVVHTHILTVFLVLLSFTLNIKKWYWSCTSIYLSI